ncbi:hypothetical protein DS043_26930 [Escherichia coli]|nr:hypothetical protein [Escherichia coli]EFO4691416.1 hypothetical protein [Escherichia coli]EFO4700097.1 hypothetical protein [Escherichia coli]EFX8385446.1 hypothetical protein [Shigella dysenteriae]
MLKDMTYNCVSNFLANFIYPWLKDKDKYNYCFSALYARCQILLIKAPLFVRVTNKNYISMMLPMVMLYVVMIVT